MKKMLLLTFLTLLTVSAFAFAGTPAIFYSDLTSGPKTGGKDNLGVIVTITGKNFGASRGAGTVSVGGGQAGAYLLWTDTKIAFQPGSNAQTGSITVTTGEGTSNGMPFTVRAGSIYFVDDTSPNSTGTGTYADPWRSPKSFYTAMKAGDTCYFRGGTYTGSYGVDTYASFNFGSGAPSGTLNNEIAFIGYPGEKAHFQHTRAFTFGYPKTYYIIAELSMYGTSKAMSMDGSYIKVVNCKMEGLKTHAYGIIHPMTGHHFTIYGCEFFGATSGDKRDHPIYIGYGTDDVDVGWCHFHDNNVAEGPVISINTDYAITEHWRFDNIRIHDSVFDCRGSSGLRGIGIVATDRGSSVHIYNNVFIEPAGSAIYQYSASAYIYNNVFHNSKGGQAILLNTVLDVGNDYRPETVEIRNNIFNNQSGGSYISLSNESRMTSVSIDHNAYSGAGNGPTRDTFAVNIDPLFVNKTAYDFRLTQNSPCIDKGIAPSALAIRDRDGVSRPQGSACDIGGYEYYTGSPRAETPGLSLSGTVRDKAGAPVPGVTVTLSGASAGSVTTGQDGAYLFNALAAGEYTVTAALSGFTFEPASRASTIAAGSLGGLNFTALRALRIAGYARNGDGDGLAGVEVSLFGTREAKAVTGSDGSFAFTGLPEGGSYSARAAKSGYFLDPMVLNAENLSADISTWVFSGSNVTASLPESGIRVIGSSEGRGSIRPDLGETVKLFFKGGSTGDYSCRIFTLNGEMMWEGTLNGVQEGTFEWLPGTCASGIYVAHVKGPGLSKAHKIAVLR